MPRRYRRYSKKSAKYSIEHTITSTPQIASWSSVPAADESQANSKQWFVSVIAPTDVEGMRKVKHFTLSFCNFLDGTERTPLIYALVFVPQGYSPQHIFYPNAGYAQDMYQANQFVISSGVLDFSGGPLRIRSHLSRNLNSGDSIYLILATGDYETPVSGSYFVEISYAITLQ